MNIAMVPMRAGSKGIPNKNVREMCGMPLFYWAFKAAVESEYLSQVWLNTESEEYAEVVSDMFPSIEVHIRPQHLANGITKMEDVMLEFCEYVTADRLVTIQVTNPLVKSSDIDGALEHFGSDGLHSLFTGVRLSRFVWMETSRIPHWVAPLNYSYQMRPNRQDMARMPIVENGAFYITDIVILNSTKCRLGGKIGCWEMGMDSFFEVDEEDDWVRVERELSGRISKES